MSTDSVGQAAAALGGYQLIVAGQMHSESETLQDARVRNNDVVEVVDRYNAESLLRRLVDPSNLDKLARVAQGDSESIPAFKRRVLEESAKDIKAAPCMKDCPGNVDSIATKIGVNA